MLEQLSQVIEDSLQDIFMPLLNELQQTLANLSQQTNGVEADVATLKQLHLRCQDV